MKVIWEPKDIYPNRKIVNTREGSDRSWIIGVFAVGGDYALIDNDDVVWDKQTKSEMAKYLTDYGYMPAELV